MTTPSLRRYTNLAATFHILENRCLTLLNPKTWDDKNDAYFIEEYKKKTKAQTVLALCFAEAPETYHHWRVFSHGPDGVCIQFDKAALENSLASHQFIKSRSVTYMTINEASSVSLDVEDLPFLKRIPYEDEIEFRLLYVDRNEDKKFKKFEIPLNSIDRITLSPWMHSSLVGPVRRVIKSLKGCQKLKVYQSTLIENERWMRVATQN